MEYIHIFYLVLNIFLLFHFMPILCLRIPSYCWQLSFHEFVLTNPLVCRLAQTSEHHDLFSLKDGYCRKINLLFVLVCILMLYALNTFVTNGYTQLHHLYLNCVQVGGVLIRIHLSDGCNFKP